jgi:hypothetical protein
MTTSQEWAEKFFNYVAQDHQDPKKKPVVTEPPGQEPQPTYNPDEFVHEDDGHIEDDDEE